MKPECECYGAEIDEFDTFCCSTCEKVIEKHEQRGMRITTSPIFHGKRYSPMYVLIL